MTDSERKPDPTREERVEDLDVPETESEDVKGGYGGPAAGATGTGAYGSTWKPLTK